MSALATARRVGWCPGALRPMVSGDGLIVRLKPRGGTLTPEQGIGIASAAARFGSGALDLTSRANLQIRGGTDATLPELTAALDDLGLLDDSPEAEARRNVMVSPLAGLDPSAPFDIRPAVAALEATLVAEDALAGLPAKFGFAVSDGGDWPLDGVSADVRFEAIRDSEGRAAFAIRLDGDEALAAACAASTLPEMAVRLARAFLGERRRDADLHRMRDLVARDGAEAVFDRAGIKAPVRRGREQVLVRAIVGLLDIVASDAKRSGSSCPQPGSLRREALRNDGGEAAVCSDLSSAASRHLLPGGGKGGTVLGVAAAFGRLDAAQLDDLARRAATAAASELRLTPWRALLVPGLDRPAAAALAAACAAAGFIVDPADPRLRVAACAGAPGCHRGTTPTLDHAARWARLVGPGQGIRLHVSGCAKGCADPGSAALTLVGRDGRYDIVVEGRPGGAPSALGLDADEARRLIRSVLRDAHP